MQTEPTFSPIIGVIGGAGPDATIDFQKALSQQMKQQCQAITDQHHFRVIVDNYTVMPDRSQALLGRGPSPLPYLQKIAQNLASLGATMITCPCNTAHAYIDALQAAISVPILDMPYLTCQAVTASPIPLRRIGVLCTDMTKKHQLYHIPRTMLVYPDHQYQALVMQGIFAAKAGYTHEPITDTAIQAQLRHHLSLTGVETSLLDFQYSAADIYEKTIAHLQSLGVDAVILGCTEIPLCVDTHAIERRFGFPVINPTNELAKAAVALAINQCQQNIQN